MKLTQFFSKLGLSSYYIDKRKNGWRYKFSKPMTASQMNSFIKVLMKVDTSVQINIDNEFVWKSPFKNDQKCLTIHTNTLLSQIKI